MTSPEPFSRQELIELAALHAFGLLDEFDAADYTRSLMNAPAPVQDEIRRLQAEIAGDATLLPDEEPSPSLRQRVLDRVAEAIEADTARLAPLATIGRARGRRGTLDARPVMGSFGQYWRAAAFALAGGLIVLAYFFSDASRQNNRITELALSRMTDELLQLVGPQVTDYLRDPTAKHIVLNPASGSPGPGWAHLMLREDGSNGFLVFGGLPPSSFELQVTLDDGTTRTIATFDSTGMTAGGHHMTTINLAAGMLTSATWQIATEAGQVLLTSA